MNIRDNLPTLFVGLIVGFSFMILLNHAKADSTTPKEFANKLAQVPVKLQSHISMEIEKTKEFQAKNWIKVKSDLLKLKKLFIKN